MGFRAEPSQCHAQLPPCQGQDKYWIAAGLRCTTTWVTQQRSLLSLYLVQLQQSHTPLTSSAHFVSLYVDWYTNYATDDADARTSLKLGLDSSVHFIFLQNPNGQEPTK